MFDVHKAPIGDHRSALVVRTAVQACHGRRALRCTWPKPPGVHLSAVNRCTCTMAAQPMSSSIEAEMRSR